MESVSIMPASLADRIPLPDEALTARMLAKAREGFDRKIVVLDDDPTGVQTVHDLPVYTDWRRETLESGLTEEGTMFFVLTNSRGFSQQETEHAHREIAENLLAASEKTGVPFLLVSRGDSTLRGHYPLETETLRQTLEEHSSVRYDGEIVMPYFKEGGRLTIGNVHYVQTGDCLTPAGLTEFARDTTFAYNASNLLDWCEERTGGHYTARDMTAISLEELRALDYDTILQKLMAVKDFGKVIVNAAEDRDVEVFTAALLEAVKQGKEFLIRSAAGLVRVLGNVDHRPLLKREELRGTDTGVGGLVVVGSHVKKTTEQLECLLNAGLELCPICFDAESAFTSGGLEKERDRVLMEAERAIRSGKTAVVYTSRRVLRTRENDAQGNLNLSVRISEAMTSVVGELTVRPAFLIAKGGITSSDVGIRALGVHRAWVMGQVAPGVPVWRTGEESKFPGLSYVIFPGNVGGVTTLRDIVAMLLMP